MNERNGKKTETLCTRDYLKSAAKNKGVILKINKKNFQDEELPPELFLSARQKARIRNAFAKNMSTDIKLGKAQISKIIQSGGTFGPWLATLRKKAQVFLNKLIDKITF